MDDFLALLEKCAICPRVCRAQRLKGEKGYCGIANGIIIAHYGPHFGEEPPISGTGGSGNIFFSSCNLHCVFCQNYQISHERTGKPVSVEGLVEIFFALKNMGCHNINLVSPTPYVPFIAVAIEKAKKKGIRLPFVYNTNAYEQVETLRMLEGMIDIYLPDFKYWGSRIAEKLSGAPAERGYPEHARTAIMEMQRQVGSLHVEDGLAKKGVLVRHLVLPGNLAGSRQIIEWIRDHMGTDTFVSLMSQYYPLYQAEKYPMINRRVRQDEYDRLVGFLADNGFENVFIQELDSAPLFVPDFGKALPFQDTGYSAEKLRR